MSSGVLTSDAGGDSDENDDSGEEDDSDENGDSGENESTDSAPQPNGGVLPNPKGRESSLSAVFGRASSRRKVKAIHRLCYGLQKSFPPNRLRNILLGYEVVDLEPMNLRREYQDD